MTESENSSPLCQYCEDDFRTTDRDDPNEAEFMMKTFFGYGAACESCCDELIAHAPNNNMVVHGV